MCVKNKKFTNHLEHCLLRDILADKLKDYSDGLILDVGSGANPFPPAHVSCDIRRMQMKAKPFVTCDGEYLPFRRSIFDFVHCSHVLEHADNPELLFRELRRVGKHGYVESPSWFLGERRIWTQHPQVGDHNKRRSALLLSTKETLAPEECLHGEKKWGDDESSRAHFLFSP